MHIVVPTHIEPAWQEDAVPLDLVETANRLIQSSRSLGRNLPTRTLADLVAMMRMMNSSYTNRIEGNNTQPPDIERALAGDFDRMGERLTRYAVPVGWLATCGEAIIHRHVAKYRAGAQLSVRCGHLERPAKVDMGSRGKRALEGGLLMRRAALTRFWSGRRPNVASAVSPQDR